MRVIQRVLLGVVLVATVLLAEATSSEAQNLGTFRWQLTPFCNVVTYAVVREGSVFVLSGFDDRCGATPSASSSGTAFLNPDGTVSLGVTTVQPAVTGHFTMQINLSTLSGTWSNDLGQAGPFGFLGLSP